jgi:hypothetical protein
MKVTGEIGKGSRTKSPALERCKLPCEAINWRRELPVERAGTAGTGGL